MKHAARAQLAILGLAILGSVVPREIGFRVGPLTKDYLSIIGPKDVAKIREVHGDEGSEKHLWVEAGRGMVPWSEVFAELTRVGYEGPLSVHAAFEGPHRDEYFAAVQAEIAYFKKKRHALRPPQDVSPSLPG